jgi:hypothetical protein
VQGGVAQAARRARSVAVALAAVESMCPPWRPWIMLTCSASSTMMTASKSSKLCRPVQSRAHCALVCRCRHSTGAQPQQK